MAVRQLDTPPPAGPPVPLPRVERGERSHAGFSAERKQAIAGYLFVLPAMLIFFVFTLLPVLYAAYLSFTNYDVFTRQDWIGAVNYQYVLEDELFWRALQNTLYYT